MYSFTLYLIASIIILIGAINWGMIGFFGINLVKQFNDLTLNSNSFENIIYIIVGLAGIFMLFNRTF